MKTKILSLIVLFSLALYSCQSVDDANPTNTDGLVLKSAEIAVTDLMVESVIEEANYEAAFFADAERLLHQLARFKGHRNLIDGKQGMRYLAGQCPNVSIDTSNTDYPIVITLDYGDGTELENGRVISGTIIIEISAPRGTDGATRSITYVECVIDSVGIDGTCTDVFNGDNLTSRKFTSNSDVTFTMADGTVVDRLGNHVRDWNAGIETPMFHADDVIEITGSTNLSSSAGYTWTRVIVVPLIKLGDCRYNVQGVVQFSQDGAVLSEINFGDGECDNIALLTVDGETIEIELRGRKPEAKLEGRN